MTLILERAARGLQRPRHFSRFAQQMPGATAAAPLYGLARETAESTISTTSHGRPTVVPELSRFLGIVIAMYYRDHMPAHFHAFYGDFEITVELATGNVGGQFPRRALAHVQEWRRLHREELLEAWTLAAAGRPLPKIEPLE